MKLLTGFQNMREKLMELKGEIDKLKIKPKNLTPSSQ